MVSVAIEFCQLWNVGQVQLGERVIVAMKFHQSGQIGQIQLGDPIRVAMEFRQPRHMAQFQLGELVLGVVTTGAGFMCHFHEGSPFYFFDFQVDITTFKQICQ